MIAAAPKPTYHNRIWTVVEGEFLRTRVLAIMPRVVIISLLLALMPKAVSVQRLTSLVIPLYFMFCALNNEMLEPLIASGVRRRDIILGKFVASSLFLATWVMVIVLFEAILMRIPWLASIRPAFLTLSFMTQVAIVAIVRGSEVLAIMYFYSSLRTVSQRTAFWFVGSVMIVAAFFTGFFVRDHTFLAAFPYFAFADFDWHLKHTGSFLVQESSVISIIVASLFLTWTIRRLNNGALYESEASNSTAPSASEGSIAKGHP